MAPSRVQNGQPEDLWLDPDGRQLLDPSPKSFPELLPLGRGSAQLPEPGTQQQPPGRGGAAPPAVPAKTPTPETVRQEKREQKFTFSHLAFLCTQLISA